MEKLELKDDDIEDVVEVLQDYDFITSDIALELGEPVNTLAPNPYFGERGVDESACVRYNLHFKEGSYPAAVFPVPNVRGDIIGAVYRFIDPKSNRYVKMGRMTPVWPMNFLPLFGEGQTVIVCEGAFSALRLNSHFSEPGINLPVLSLFGAKASQEIVDVLTPFRPVFLYDDDRAGNAACRKMRRLNPVAHSYTLSTAPDDMSREQLAELLCKIACLE